MWCFGDSFGGQYGEYGLALSCGGWKAVLRPGGNNSYPEIRCCRTPQPSFCPFLWEWADVRCLWAIWFFRARRPRFYEHLVAKKKGIVEGVNVVWLRSAREADEWLDSLKSAVNQKVDGLE
jgi:hypothetical protein